MARKSTSPAPRRRSSRPSLGTTPKKFTYSAIGETTVDADEKAAALAHEAALLKAREARVARDNAEADAAETGPLYLALGQAAAIFLSACEEDAAARAVRREAVIAALASRSRCARARSRRRRAHRRRRPTSHRRQARAPCDGPPNRSPPRPRIPPRRDLRYIDFPLQWF